MTYKAPVRDLIFALNEAADFSRLQHAFPGADADTVLAVLEAAGSFSGEVLAPLNAPGDRVGAKFENGQVVSAPGFADAYRQFAAGGWNSLAADPGHGGQGLPKALEIAVFEMIQAANMAFGLCPMLTQGAIEAIGTHGTARQKSLYLPRLVSGEWTGTMNLTEPASGSDLGAITTRAEPDGNGGYALTGTKIFITWGDHDVADNIVHLVLARLPDAPPGTRGLTLFLSPKRLVNEDGTLGAANGVRPASIEHKLGVHASPTCVMLFEGAKAEMVSAPNQGLAAMFVMMNDARLQVGVQGVAIAERAYQQALAYSLERKQGRSAWTGTYPSRLFDHPDVRRSLMLMKAKISAARAICLSTAVAADLARTAGNPVDRDSARFRQELLTPIAKAWSTDIGVEVASMGLQIHGGMGFIEETGAAQYMRDSKILTIYEGTTAIQANDFVGRKTARDGGTAAKAIAARIESTEQALAASPSKDAQAFGKRLTAARLAFLDAVAFIAGSAKASPNAAFAGSVPYLMLAGNLVGGWQLGRALLVAVERIAAGDDVPFMTAKIATARFYGDHILSKAAGVRDSIVDGAEGCLAMPLTAF